MDQKESQRLIYNRSLLNNLGSGLGVEGFNKIKTLKDFVNYRSINNLNLKSGEKVLDVGCNAGELLNKIVATYHVSGYGIDISDKTIGLAKKYNPFANKYIVGDAEKMPYRNNYFDAIISTDVLEHVPYPERVMAEIGRMLKPRGRFYVYCISKRNFLTIGWFMQRFHCKHAWGDLGDHQKDFLIDPKVIFKMSVLRVKKIFYFNSFFMHLFDEFVIRPFLALVAKNHTKQGTFDKKPKIKQSIHLVRPGASALIYLFFLQIVYYFALILDSPWRLFKLSNAVLVSGHKE